MEITDVYTLSMVLSVLIVIYLLGNKALSSKMGSNPRDTAYKDALKIKSDSQKELQTRINALNQKVYHLTKGASKEISELANGKEENMVDAEIEELYNKYVPAGLKDLVPFEAARDWLEKNPEEIKKVVGRFKKEGANGRFDLGASDSI